MRCAWPALLIYCSAAARRLVLSRLWSLILRGEHAGDSCGRSELRHGSASQPFLFAAEQTRNSAAHQALALRSSRSMFVLVKCLLCSSVLFALLVMVQCDVIPKPATVVPFFRRRPLHVAPGSAHSLLQQTGSDTADSPMTRASLRKAAQGQPQPRPQQQQGGQPESAPEATPAPAASSNPVPPPTIVVPPPGNLGGYCEWDASPNPCVLGSDCSVVDCHCYDQSGMQSTCLPGSTVRSPRLTQKSKKWRRSRRSCS
jgi:hypothetical protein